MIAILRTHWVLGGAERYLSDISAALVENGHEVVLVSLSGPPRSDVLSATLDRSRASGFEHWPLHQVDLGRRSSMYDVFVNAVPSLVLSPRGRENWLVVFTPGAAAPRRLPDRARWKAGILTRRALDILHKNKVGLDVPERFGFYGYHAPRYAVRRYDRVVAISEFVARGIAQYWRCAADVVYPAIRIPEVEECRRRGKSIVSIGRFAPSGNMKHHAALIAGFRRLSELDDGWKLTLIGGFEGTPEEGSYLSDLRRAASGLAVDFLPNASDKLTASVLRSASFLWHAAGCSSGPDDYLNVEQFGIAVAEAAASGTVPLVYPAGSVSEIVPTLEGYSWRTLDDLVIQTIRTFQTSDCWERKSQAARLAARRFVLPRLREDVRNLIDGLPVRRSTRATSAAR